MAQLKLNDPTISHFFKPSKPLKCDDEKNWIYIENATFFIDKSAVDRHGEITCNYDSIKRVNDHKFQTEPVKNFQSGYKIKTDFFGIDCKARDDSVYSNVHATVKPRSTVIERSKTKKPAKNALNLNVYMFGFDSLSRMTFIRKMPKTYKYLTANLNGIVLEGYNIVGDGTPQALIPIFTGKTELELPLTRKRYSNASYVNVYPFVWNEFANAGYVTMYSEDAPDFGVFQYRLKGFKEQPTDHYLRTFYLAAQSQKRDHQRYCWGSEPHHKVHFDYSQDLWKNYPSSIRKFAFSFHATLSHDDLNMVELADDYTVDHLKFFETNGHLNSTIIIFMADHGHRFDKLRETQQGKLEERLPVFIIVLPPWFEKKYPKSVKNLRINAKRLTTPFDIHSTLRSILHFDYPPKMANLKERSINLFDEVPPSRTCTDAGIELHWCACLEWQNMSTSDDRIKLIADKLVKSINAETARERKLCSKLQLDKIEIALVYKLNNDFINFKKSKDIDGMIPDLTGNTSLSTEYYQVTIRTMPGNALYEASIAWNTTANDTIINLNDVSHINKYGDMPHCVIDKDYFLAKWCVCYDKI